MEATFLISVYVLERKNPKNDIQMSLVFTFLLGECKQLENHCCFLEKAELGVLCVCHLVMQQVSGGAAGKGKLFSILPQMVIAPVQQGQKTSVQEIGTLSTLE